MAGERGSGGAAGSARGAVSLTLARRHPWVEDSGAVLSLLDTHDETQGFVAVHTISTIHYLLSRQLERTKAGAALVDLLRLVEVVPVSHAMIFRALSLGWSDFEDAVQAVGALEVEADCVVSRDAGDFASLPIPVVTATELLNLVGAK